MSIDRSPFELQIDDLTLDGQGVGRREGKACFVAGALPGERVRAVQTGRKRNFDTAQLETVLEPAPERVEPPCEWFGVCGGCRLMHAEVGFQRLLKERNLFEALSRIGHVAVGRRLEPLVGDDLGYRRTARLGVKYVAKKGGTLVGFRERGGRYLADMWDCQVLHPAIGRRIGQLRHLIDGLDARERIPQIEAVVDDAGTAALVFRHLQPLSQADRDRLAAFAAGEGVQVYLQPGGPDTVQQLAGPQTQLRYGHPDFGVTVDFGPLDFVQVHAEINRRMVRRAIDLLEPVPDSRVLDLFCGLGNFTLPLARRAGEVVGVEGDARMLERARANAERQGIGNTRYVCANLEDEGLQEMSWLDESFDRVLLDPPRTGAAAAIEALGSRGIPRLLYVSCNPATLARDAERLVHHFGYRLDAAGIMDMFPHTAHVESMAVFARD
ncbi:23S rRNA (uracil(1939)-C(5))-methyltransferase RlmD [Thioalkalivibrio sp.]|uniref:23S rRNA (uracil(1939)-C(5))-methyltransferase RlmD n=1 Tax=Thioalkalivibrio sp. TaxID=2093813 RepID=UPI0012D5CC74|nr:23S rRNA (uracil(1939)-C(5))-methyltransferase RlmD [Thioalkalivibrio sp.]TVP77851.1 MAG: 23S rRNA (uracil(1939)-C(5))-methyltransferase RlmD [Thioalkalivibrio sp.]